MTSCGSSADARNCALHQMVPSLETERVCPTTLPSSDVHSTDAPAGASMCSTTAQSKPFSYDGLFEWLGWCRIGENTQGDEVSNTISRSKRHFTSASTGFAERQRKSTGRRAVRMKRVSPCSLIVQRPDANALISSPWLRELWSPATWVRLSASSATIAAAMTPKIANVIRRVGLGIRRPPSWQSEMNSCQTELRTSRRHEGDTTPISRGGVCNEVIGLARVVWHTKEKMVTQGYNSLWLGGSRFLPAQE